MNAMRMSTCDTPIWISSSFEPPSRARTMRRSSPQATSATDTTVSAGQDPDDPPADELAHGQPRDDDHAASPGSASSSRKRASSDPRPGSTAWIRPPAADERGHEVRDPLRGQRPDRQPVVVDARGTEPGRDRPAAVAQAGHAQPDAVHGHDLVERAGRDRAAVVEDDHPIADPLDLGQQVRVEDDRRAAVAGRADDGPHVGPADRVERGCRLVEQDRGRGHRAARRRARAVAASPSRSRSPDRRLDRADRPARAPRRPLGRDPRARSGRAGHGAPAPHGRAATAGSGTARAGSRSAPARCGRRGPRRGRGRSRSWGGRVRAAA